MGRLNKTNGAIGADLEWRNRQSNMAYRRLGRTGMMISEVISGGDPITLDNYTHLGLALDMGLNYLDMAPAYNRGDTERASAVISNLWDEIFVRENLLIAGKKVELQPA